MNGQPRFTMLGKLISVVLVLGPRRPGRLHDPQPIGRRSRCAGGGRRSQARRRRSPRSRSRSRGCRRRPRSSSRTTSSRSRSASTPATPASSPPTAGSSRPRTRSSSRTTGSRSGSTVSEDEIWSELNEGKMAASVTTVDVLAAYGKQLHAVVPAQIGFSRGADGIVVRSDIKRINQLEGQDDRDGAVHRGRLLHPLPRAGSGPGDQHARQPGRDAASGAAEPRLHRRRLRRRRSVPATTSSRARTGSPGA